MPEAFAQLFAVPPPAPASASADPEQRRLQALFDTDLLDTDPEPEYDDIVALASATCDTPMSLITLVDDHRQWFKAYTGIADRETPRDVAFCAHAIQEPNHLFEIPDATNDPRFKSNPLVTGGPAIRFYAGMPIVTSGGAALGTLCVIDTKPRVLTDRQRTALRILAGHTQTNIELRLKAKRLRESLAETARLTATLQSSYDTFRAFMDYGPFLSYIKDADGRMLFYNAQYADHYKIALDQWIGKSDHELWPERTADRLRDADTEVLESGRPLITIEQSPSRSGNPTQWKSYRFPIQREDGQWLLAGMSLDVTTEIEREVSLALTLRQKNTLIRDMQSQRGLTTAFQENSPNLYFIKSGQGRYVSYNRAFADYFDIDTEAWVGRSDREVLPPEIGDLLYDENLKVALEKQPSEFAITIPDAGGFRSNFRCILFPLRGTGSENLVGGALARTAPEPTI